MNILQWQCYVFLKREYKWTVVVQNEWMTYQGTIGMKWPFGGYLKSTGVWIVISMWIVEQQLLTWILDCEQYSSFTGGNIKCKMCTSRYKLQSKYLEQVRITRSSHCNSYFILTDSRSVWRFLHHGVPTPPRRGQRLLKVRSIWQDSSWERGLIHWLHAMWTAECSKDVKITHVAFMIWALNYSLLIMTNYIINFIWYHFNW